MSSLWKVTVAFTAVVATVLVSCLPLPATAASGCWGSVAVNDPRGPARYCHNYVGGQVYGDGYGSGPTRYMVGPVTDKGYLRAGDNWFVCQQRYPGFENPRVGRARNDWWLYTQADVAHGPGLGWGMFPATMVSGGQNWQPIPGLKLCHFGMG